LFLPLTFNDGRPIPRRLFDSVERRLLARFNGLTSVRGEFPLKGIWLGKGRLYFDQVITMTAFDVHRGRSDRFVTQLKMALLAEFEQEEILITETSVRVD